MLMAGEMPHESKGYFWGQQHSLTLHLGEGVGKDMGGVRAVDKGRDHR